MTVEGRQRDAALQALRMEEEPGAKECRHLWKEENGKKHAPQSLWKEHSHADLAGAPSARLCWTSDPQHCKVTHRIFSNRLWQRQKTETVVLGFGGERGHCKVST